MNTTSIPVILTGILARNPEPVLAPDRTLICALTVTTRNLYFVHHADESAPCPSYTVHITNMLRDVLFFCADKGNPVTIPGYLDKTAGIVHAGRVFNVTA